MAEQQAAGLWRADVDIGPEAPLVKHTHPGEGIIYILEGSLEYQSKASRRGRSKPVRP